MADVVLPFLPAWRAAVLDGSKTTSVRTRRFGAAGDRFEVEGRAFTLVRVEALALADAARASWRSEGFAREEDFAAHWAKLHPSRGFRPSDTVWVHEFRRIDARAH